MDLDSPFPESSSAIPANRVSRKVQFYLVLTVAFAIPIASSLLVFFGHRTLHTAAERAFKGLSDGATIQMPMDQTFFAKKFGMLVDKFGTHWMVICEKPM